MNRKTSSPKKLTSLTTNNKLIKTPKTTTLNLNKTYKEKFENAAKQGKIFTLIDGYSKIRELLIKRGWIEKLSPDYMKAIQLLPHDTLLGLIRPGNIYETVAISKLAYNYKPKFLWQRRHNNNNTLIESYHNCINRSDNLNFTTKHGINNCIENSYWNNIKGISKVLAPRFHCISDPEQYLVFLRDYRTTYCCSLIKFITNCNNLTELFSENGDIPFDAVEYAIRRIRVEIMIRTTNDINILKKKNPFGDDSNDELKFSVFYSNVNLLIKKQGKIKLLDTTITNDIRNTCQELIDNFKKIWPLLTCEGYNNLWILKPGYSSRGRGIYIKNNFHEIVNFVRRQPLKKYILQKYIEEPLLIYKTKFDIRQHILLTIINDKFNIWMYKDCYLRFCSQEYNLNNLSESIHLTNRSIQQKYKNGIRNIKLPNNNMWLLKDFKLYLKSIKKDDIWNKKIYPDIKKNIIGVILASLDETDLVDNKFDLYGCDFMINKFYETILIEINSSPDMLPTTSVTSKLCSSVLNDLIKVVVDLPDNNNIDIGKFDLIYSVDLKTRSKRNNNSNYNYNNINNNKNNNNNNINISVAGKSLKITKPHNSITKMPSEIRNIINTNLYNNDHMPNYLKNYRITQVTED